MISHYVPRFILRKFSDSLCVYNTETGILTESIRPEHAFAESGFYDSDTEKKLNLKIESQFGDLLANKLLKANETVVLCRKELLLIKKFLLISVIRSMGSQQLMQVEKIFYDKLAENINKQNPNKQVTKEQIAPFREPVINGESDFDYWIRTLNVILDTDGTPDAIAKHDLRTYPAHRWAQVISAGYLAFWDVDSPHDEFVITDIGMTSENEKGWNGITNHNKIKMDLITSLLDVEKDESMRSEIYKQISFTAQFHENFQMFPISANRMIVEIAPFFKFRQIFKSRYPMPPLEILTVIPNEELFYPNNVQYVLPQTGKCLTYHKNDLYIYTVKKLSSEEVHYCNALFMDRIDTNLGFSSLNKAVRSIIKYKRLNEFPYTPRVDYTPLYRIIENRYGGKLNV